MRQSLSVSASKLEANTLDLDSLPNSSHSLALMETLQPDPPSSNGHHKRKLDDGLCFGEAKRLKTSPLKVIDYSNPYAVSKMLEELDGGKYGSVTKDIQEMAELRLGLVKDCIWRYPSLAYTVFGGEKRPQVVVEDDVINLDDDEDEEEDGLSKALCVVPDEKDMIVICDSDEEESESQRAMYPFQSSLVLHQKSQGEEPVVMPTCSFEEVLLGKGKEKYPAIKVVVDGETRSDRVLAVETGKEKVLAIGNDVVHDKGVYVGVQDDYSGNESEAADEDLGDIWNEMALSIVYSKGVAGETSHKDPKAELIIDCDHSYVLKDDVGYVCRVCGVIDQSILDIIDVNFNKAKRSTRTYVSETKKKRFGESDAELKFYEEGLMIGGLAAHSIHAKMMKPHQVEGFQFLCSNLVAEEPGGCIMAHAPGSGKTFMIISFMQSFLAKYPQAKPLVVLPKGILSTWKREFVRWQVEDIPLFDFYSAKANNREDQLEILDQWMAKKSILFLGYKQFSQMVCDVDQSDAALRCQEILLKGPSILILDEGHTPRNEDTNQLQSLAQVQTPRKVVLSGTLYQNHVKEVFNILNLVRPKFLRLETSRSVVRRIMTRIPSDIRKNVGNGSDLPSVFNEVVEHILQKGDFKVKANVIKDLREMTQKVLHYYKGDFLDELPGLDDFTVVLNLSPRQLSEVKKFKHEKHKFKVSSLGSSIYLHPKLKDFSGNSNVSDTTMDQMLEKLDLKEGAKANFFLNLIDLCDSVGEKLLVFSTYLVPLKFLERLANQVKGWKLGKEVFVLKGKTSMEERESSMERFNNSPDARVFFGQIKTCGEGISLVGASRILILDVHLNPSVTRQAIGRAFRPGQTKKVHVYRLIAGSSPEEEDHKTCFKKEVISKMWFEWNEHCGYRNFEVETIDVDDSGDAFLESPALREDIRVLYKR